MVLCLMIVGIHASEILSPLAQFILVRLKDLRRTQSRSMKKRQPTVKTQTSAISVHAHNTGHHSFSEEVNLTDHDPNYCTYKIKEEIRIRLPQQNK